MRRIIWRNAAACRRNIRASDCTIWASNGTQWLPRLWCGHKKPPISYSKRFTMTRTRWSIVLTCARVHPFRRSPRWATGSQQPRWVHNLSLFPLLPLSLANLFVLTRIVAVLPWWCPHRSRLPSLLPSCTSGAGEGELYTDRGSWQCHPLFRLSCPAVPSRGLAAHQHQSRLHHLANNQSIR